jgi:hypothetical protein
MGKVGLYIAGVVAAAAIGLGIGAVYHEELGHATDVAVYQMAKRDTEFRDYCPKFLVESWDWMARKTHGVSQEELDQKREESLKDLEQRANANTAAD